MPRRFRDRAHAGVELAERVAAYRRSPGFRGSGGVVLGLPRGGVAVAAPVARALDLPLDAFVVRKVGVPHHEELAMGAVAPGGIVVWNDDVLAMARVSDERRDEAVVRERAELERRVRAYRGDRAPLAVQGLDVVIVDDGLATGATMSAAVTALQSMEPAQLVVAVPVAPRTSFESFARRVDAVLSVVVTDHFGSVGEWYDDFSATTDAEVVALLRGE
jgi:putative phosphoribosyl transferase